MVKMFYYITDVNPAICYIVIHTAMKPLNTSNLYTLSTTDSVLPLIDKTNH